MIEDIVVTAAVFACVVLLGVYTGYAVGNLSSEIKHLKANRVRRHVCDRCHVEEFSGGGDE